MTCVPDYSTVRFSPELPLGVIYLANRIAKGDGGEIGMGQHLDELVFRREVRGEDRARFPELEEVEEIWIAFAMPNWEEA